MSQHDFTIENQTAVSARADINNALQALASTSSGSSAPTSPTEGMLWYDTGSNRLKLRENSSWVEIGTFTGGNFSVAGLTLASQAEAEAGTNNTKLMTPLRVKQAIEDLTPQDTGFSSSQSWTDVTSSRNKGTTYTNSTGRMIQVSIVTRGGIISSNRQNHSAVGYVNSMVLSRQQTTNGGSYLTTQLIVPNGSNYKIDVSGSSSGYVIADVYEWRELS